MPNKQKKHLDLLEILLKRTGNFMGIGTNHENKEFKGNFEMLPIVNKKGIFIKYKVVGTAGIEFNKHETLYNIDTVLFNEEHTVIAYDNKNQLSLWTLNNTITTFLKFDLRRYKQITAKHHLFIFGFGDPDKNNIYREEITIELWENGDLGYNYSWGEAGGHFISRSTIRMKKMH